MAEFELCVFPCLSGQFQVDDEEEEEETPSDTGKRRKYFTKECKY